MTFTIQDARMLSSLYRHMDWSHENSDDYRVVKRGRAKLVEITLLMQKMGFDSSKIVKKSYDPSVPSKVTRDFRIAFQSSISNLVIDMARKPWCVGEVDEHGVITIKEDNVENHNVNYNVNPKFRQWSLDNVTIHQFRRIVRVERLRQAVAPDASWPDRLYATLRVRSGVADGKRYHQLSFVPRGHKAMSYKVRKNFLANVAEKMQELGYTTDTRGASRMTARHK